MAGREVKGGIVIHPIIATAILGVVVTLGISARSEMNWQHDQLVRLATQKEDAEKAASQEHFDRQQQASADQAWRESMNNKMNNLNNLVSQAQIKKGLQ